MHPLIRILGLLALLVFLARADWPALLVAALLLACLYGLSTVANGARLWRMVARLRYVFLAILLAFGLGTPGEALADWPGLAWFSREGLVLGGERVAGLVLIVAAVHWLLETTARDELAASLYWLLRPLAWLRVPVDRFVLRLVLTLERIEAMLDHARRVRERPGQPEARDGLVQRAAMLVEQTLSRAEAEQGAVVNLQLSSLPGVWQWLGWLLYVAALLLLGPARMLS